MKFYGVFAIVLLATVLSAHASTVEITDPCYTGGIAGVNVGFDPNASLSGNPGTMILQNTCEGSTQVQFQNTTLPLGPIMDNEVIVTNRMVSVDTLARPDLDIPARLIFRNVGFVMEPRVLRNGVLCGVNECENRAFNYRTQEYSMDVGGFSTYTLAGLNEFTVYSDPEAELDNKVYQTIDLGDTNRGEEFSCVVQIYGKNAANEWVLVQTNPRRQVQATLFGNPDTNQPEALGYFPTKNGMANVYYMGDTLAGYQDLEYVAQCANNSSKLVYEESISTRYHPLGRNSVGRGIWLTSGSNALFLIIYVVAGFIVLLLVVKFIKAIFKR